MPMWGQSIAPAHGWRESCFGATRLPRANALQELFEIFPEDRQSMLKVAGEHGNWREVLALHLQSVDEMPAEERGESYCNTARSLVGAQHWQHALRLIGDFRERASPALFWSGEGERSICQLLLSIHSRWGSWKEIMEVLQEAQLYPDAVTSECRSCAMQAFTKLGSWQRALQVMADKRAAIECDKEMYIAGMNAWVSGYHWRKVFDMLQQMDQENLILDEQVYGSALAACYSVANGDSLEAASAAKATSLLLRDMRQRGLGVTRRLWDMAIMANARAGDSEDALRLLLEIRDQEPEEGRGLAESSFEHFSRSCMRAFRRAGHWRNMLVLLKEMPPDTKSFEEALKACAENGKWQWTMELMQQMKELFLPVEQRTYASLISAYSAAKQWRPALWTLDVAERGGQVAEVGLQTVSLYNKVITAFVKEAAWRRAMWLLHDMPERQVQPDVVTYGAVSCVCNRARQYLYALQLHEDMVRKDINPDISSFKTAVAACRGKMKLLLQAAPAESRRQKLL